MTVTFGPTEPGDATATLLVRSNASNATVALSGAGARARSPAVVVADGPVDFGTVPVNGSGVRTVTVRNTGTAPLSVRGFDVGGTAADAFVVEDGGFDLAPNASRSVAVAFTPNRPGNATATLSVRSNASNATVLFIGTGEAGADALGVAPPSVDFGTVAVNESATRTVTVSNDGAAPTTVTGVRLRSTTGATVPISVSGVSTPFTLTAGESTPVTLTLEPSTTGQVDTELVLFTRAGDRTVGVSGDRTSVTNGPDDGDDGGGDDRNDDTGGDDGEGEDDAGGNGNDDDENDDENDDGNDDDDDGSSDRAENAGNAGGSLTRGPSVRFSEETVDLGQEAVGPDGTATTAVSVVNDGDELVSVTVSAVGRNATATVVAGATGDLAPGDTREVRVRVTPDSPGPFDVTLTAVTDTRATAAATATGVDVGPNVSVTPRRLVFANRTTRTVTVRNTGTVPLSVEPVRIGNDEGAYRVVQGFTLPANASRSVSVRFDRPDDRLRTATLRVRSNDSETPVVGVRLANAPTRVTSAPAVAVDGEASVNVTITDAVADQRLTLSFLRERTRDDGFALVNVSLTPRRDGRFSVNATSSEGPLDTTPDPELETGTEGRGFLSVNETIDDGNVSNVTVRFQLATDRLVGNETPEDVALYRYDGDRFVELPTRFLGERNGTHLVFAAASPGLSSFVAGVKHPRFEITQTVLSTTRLPPGGDLIAVARVENVGSADGLFTARLIFNESTVERRELTIAANGTSQAAFERAIDRPGVYGLFVNDVFVDDVRVDVNRSGDGTGTNETTGADSTASAQPLPGFEPVVAVLALVLALALGARLWGRREGSDRR
jgi:hypothetical protein